MYTDTYVINHTIQLQYILTNLEEMRTEVFVELQNEKTRPKK